VGPGGDDAGGALAGLGDGQAARLDDADVEAAVAPVPGDVVAERAGADHRDVGRGRAHPQSRQRVAWTWVTPSGVVIQ